MTAAAVLLPCSGRKTGRAHSRATGAALPVGPQDRVAQAWLAPLATLDPERPATALYQGRGFGYGRTAAREAGAPLFVISAGLGFVPGDRLVPNYGLTVASGGEDSVQRQVTGRFDICAWWATLEDSPFHEAPLAALRALPPGPILLALSTPYARLFAPVLEAMEPALAERLRIFAWNLADLLPRDLRPQILPYDGRLEEVFPGIQVDFAQRAMLHFVREVLPRAPGGAVSEHATRVEQILQAARPSPEPKDDPGDGPAP